jgi:hypothetical protein
MTTSKTVSNVAKAKRRSRLKYVPNKTPTRMKAASEKVPGARNFFQRMFSRLSPAGTNKDDRAVVVTLTVAVAAVLPLNVTEAGETAQVASVGAPLHVKATFPLNPVPPVNDMGYVAVAPADTVADVPESPLPVAKVRSAPVPLSITVSGLSNSGVTVRIPPALPPVLGAKPTDTWHEAEALSVPQLFP